MQRICARISKNLRSQQFRSNFNEALGINNLNHPAPNPMKLHPLRAGQGSKLNPRPFFSSRCYLRLDMPTTHAVCAYFFPPVYLLLFLHLPILLFARNNLKTPSWHFPIGSEHYVSFETFEGFSSSRNKMLPHWSPRRSTPIKISFFLPSFRPSPPNSGPEHNNLSLQFSNMPRIEIYVVCGWSTHTRLAWHTTLVFKEATKGDFECPPPRGG